MFTMKPSMEHIIVDRETVFNHCFNRCWPRTTHLRVISIEETSTLSAAYRANLRDIKRLAVVNDRGPEFGLVSKDLAADS